MIHTLRFDMGKLTLVAIGLLAFASTSQAAILIDFEGSGVPSQSELEPIIPYIEDGFEIVNGDTGVDNGIFDSIHPIVNTNGTDVFGWVGQGTVVLQSVDSSPFSIQFFDGSNLNFGLRLSFDVTGNLNGGGTVSQSFSVVDDSYTTFSFGPDWTNLSSVEFLANGFNGAIDNIVLNSSDGSLPEPSAYITWGLLGLCIGGVSWWRRRKR